MSPRYDVDVTVWLTPNGPGSEIRGDVSVPDDTPNEIAVQLGLRAVLDQITATYAA